MLRCSFVVLYNIEVRSEWALRQVSGGEDSDENGRVKCLTLTVGGVKALARPKRR